MELDIEIEINKLSTFVNDKITPTFENYSPNAGLISTNKLKYLLYVLELTYEHPEIEIYLKELLQNFSVEELNNSNDDYSISQNFSVKELKNFGYNDHSILHYMMYQSLKISLNSFKIIINFGVNINSKSFYENTPLHLAVSEETIFHLSVPESLEYVINIIGLFVKYGANLNILNTGNETVLDLIACYKLNEHIEIIIMTLIDFGARLNNPDLNSRTLEFIESYRSSSIKPAIKN